MPHLSSIRIQGKRNRNILGVYLPYCAKFYLKLRTLFLVDGQIHQAE